MAKPIIDTAVAGAKIVWQQKTDYDCGLPEPAILVEFMTDIVALTQEGQVINLNYETIEEFCRLLRKGVAAK
jgi:hypothetical protein